MKIHQKSGIGRQGVLSFKLECEKPEFLNICGLSLDQFMRTQYLKSRGLDAELRHGVLHAGGWTNAYVNTGLVNALNLEAGIGGASVTKIFVDVDNSAVVAGTTFAHGSSSAANGSSTVTSGATAGGATATIGSVTGIVPGTGFTFQGGTAETLEVLSVAGSVVTFTTNLATTHANASAVAWTGQVIKTTTNTLASQTMTYTGPTLANADFANGGSNNPGNLHKIGLLNTSTDAGTGLIDVIGGSGTTPYNKSFNLALTFIGTFSFTPAIAVTAVAT